ncbi:hypothetical protein DPMN_134117 [Dreissena polymorpha]|uniref:Uncharacterized protein n=1 Tax=Dreissena polymorpha TaxID=45954 RepID=A0A9D4FVN3_DREPO|nr:hypothetical protein DPMN_134117 [Dreissena polymorpha]
MTDFGLQDADNSIKQWDEMITKLNNTLRPMVDNDYKMENQLKQLEKELFKETKHYSQSESLIKLKERFEGYNRTLDAVKTSTHDINITLANSAKDAIKVFEQLTERDTILTTTPATTTPSGPPDCKLILLICACS